MLSEDIRTAVADLSARTADLERRLAADLPPGVIAVFDSQGVELVRVVLHRPAFTRRDGLLVLRPASGRILVDGVPSRYVLLDGFGQELLSGQQGGAAMRAGWFYQPEFSFSLPLDVDVLSAGATLEVTDAAGETLATFPLPAPEFDGSMVRYPAASTTIVATGVAAGFRLKDGAGVAILDGDVVADGMPLPDPGIAFIAFSSVDFAESGELHLAAFGFTLEIET